MSTILVTNDVEANGYVSVTPIGLDLTNQRFLQRFLQGLQHWNLQAGAE